MQAHKSKSQSVVETDLFDQETSRNSCKRSYNAMKETDITNSVDGMDTYGKENEENKQGGIYVFIFYAMIVNFCIM